jgi:glycosidase
LGTTKWLCLAAALVAMGACREGVSKRVYTEGDKLDGGVGGGDAGDGGKQPGPDGGSGGGDGGACQPTPTCSFDLSFPKGNEQKVLVFGDWNGWSAGVAMQASGNRWTASIPSLASGQYLTYKFQLDGASWVPDPENPDRVPDGLGGQNSIAAVSCGACSPAAGMAAWQSSVMYMVFLDRFANGDPGNDHGISGAPAASNYQGGDLAGLLGKINDGYFDTLGVNTLWLTSPIENANGVETGSDGEPYTAYHGYWPLKVDAIEDHLGNLDDLKKVVDAAHGRGIRVLVDYVMHHVHQASTVYHDHPDWFWPNNNCICGQGCSWDNLPDRTRCWFDPFLPTFDFEKAEPRKFSVDNAISWAKQTGIDGYRLDAVKHIDTSWITDLKARVHSELESSGKVFYLIGETFSADKSLIKSYVDPASKLTGQFDFPERSQVLRSVLMRQAPMSELDGFLDGNDGFYGSGTLMGTFLGNHDLPRLIHLAENQPQFGDWDSGKARGWSNQPSLPPYPEPFQRVAVAYAFLMTTRGVPLIYYGDEIGMPGAGDPDNRRMMQWSNLSANQEWLRTRIGKLASIRAAHPALARGVRQKLFSNDDLYVYEMLGAKDHLWVALNRGDSAQGANGLPAGKYRDLVGDADVSAPLSVGPRSAMILVAR